MAALLAHIRVERQETHRRIFALVDDLTDAQLSERLGNRAPSIGFHVWHLARWADCDVELIQGTRQIWHEQSLAQAWGMPPVLGKADAGTELGDDATERLVLPSKGALVDYARATFGELEASLDSVTSDTLLRPIQSGASADESVVDLIFTHLVHDNRHLGMIEALRGLLGLSGSATN
jgi:DinB superfamily